MKRSGKGAKKGREGRHEGMGGMLRKQIAMKFGELPEWAEQHLASATDAQLEAWALQILTANSLQEMLKH